MVDVTRTVRRRTAATQYSRGRSREVIIELAPPGNIITFRLAGERRRFSLSTSVAYAMAVRAEAESRRAAKKLAREQRRKARQ